MSMATLYLSFFKTTAYSKRRSCKFCGKMYAISTGLGVLGRHLINKHPEYLNETTHNRSTPETAIQVRNSDLTPPQPSIHDSDNVNILIFKWMVDANIRQSQIQNEYFVNALRASNISLWSNERMNHMITNVYEKMRGDVETALEEVNSRLSGVIEVWSSHKGLVYMGVSCSWVANDWVVHRLLLDTVKVPFPYKTNEMISCMVKVFQMYNIERKLLFCTINGTEKEVLACEAYKDRIETKSNQFWYIQCIGRIIYDIIEAGTCCLKPFLSKLRYFVFVINGNEEILSDFKKFMVMHQEDFLEFHLEVDANIFGDFSLLEIVYKAPKSMESTIKKHRTAFNTEYLPLNNMDKAAINAVHVFMQPFRKVIEHLSSTGQTATLGLFLFFLDHVTELINSYKDIDSSSSSSSNPHEWMKTMPEAMAKSAQTIPTSQLHTLPTFVASILDPRIKKSLLPAALDFDAHLDEAKKMFRDVYDAKKASSSTAEELEEVSYAEAVARERRKGVATAGFDELSQYLSEAPLDMDADPFDWWKRNDSRYPRLSLMARDYLAVQPTIDEFANLFSSKRSRVLQDRYNMSREHGEAWMCVREWTASGFSVDSAYT